MPQPESPQLQLPAAQLMVQPPPVQLVMAQVAPAAQLMVQPPPLQAAMVQLPACAQVMPQFPPPSQVPILQTAPGGQVT
jgi:hypothetical protein